ncbi:MAG: hypothetical protein ACJA2K_001913 [Thalassolituus sp.]|jgi:hypothetical protein
MVSVKHYLLPLLAVVFMQLLQPLHEVVAHGDGHEKAVVDCEFCTHVQDVKSATLNSGYLSSVVASVVTMPVAAVVFVDLASPVALARGPPAV